MKFLDLLDELERNLKDAGYDIHDLKGDYNASSYELYKDKNGNIYIKPLSGEGDGEPLYINLDDLPVDSE